MYNRKVREQAFPRVRAACFGVEAGAKGEGRGEMRIRKQELTRGTRGHASPEKGDFNSSEMRGKAFEIIKQ